jgi:alkyl hydroperoxide reductase subunit AhpC
MLVLEDKNLNYITIEDIQRAVATHYGLNEEQLHHRCLSPAYARPRQVAMFLARTLTKVGLKEIGLRFNGRNSTTALHAVRRIRDLVVRDEDIGRDVRELGIKLQELDASRVAMCAMNPRENEELSSQFTLDACQELDRQRHENDGCWKQRE